MFTYIVILLLLAGLAFSPVVLGYWRRRNAELELNHPLAPVARTAVGEELPKQRSEYRAASVLPCQKACQAAIMAKGKRILVEAAPRLPLDTCDRIRECTCTYEQHADRRNGEDRRNDFGSLSTGGGIGQDYSNLRSGLERRAYVDTDLDFLEYE